MSKFASPKWYSGGKKVSDLQNPGDEILMYFDETNLNIIRTINLKVQVYESVPP